METKEYSQMTAEELHAENLKLGKDRQAIREQQLEINKELSKRARSEELKSELARLKEKFGADTQIVGVAGIGSKQEVSAPG